MSDGIFGIGLSGLHAAQAGLVTTSHNISNANTPGYTRQQTVQATNVPLFSGSGFFGQGTNVATVKRIYNEFLVAQSQQAQSNASQLDAYLGQITQIDNLLANPDAGLTPALNGLFSSVNAVAANPNDGASRQTLMSNAQGLVDRFHTIDQRLAEMRAGVNRKIESGINAINSLSAQIGKMNEQIALAFGQSGRTQPPNDLLDQRDALLQGLNQQIGVSTVKDASGTISVFLGNGQALVVGDQSFALSAVADKNDPQTLQVALPTGSGVLQFRPQDLQGGELGGVLAFRSESLDSAQNALGRVAMVLADAFNAQHRLGQNQNAQQGGAFFAIGSPQSIAATTNSGSGVVTTTLSNSAALTASDYRLSYNGAQYTLTRLSDNSAQTFASFPQTIDGITLSLAGAPAAGDSFLIPPTRAGASSIDTLFSDPALIASAAPIRASAGGSNSGNGTITPGSVNAPPPPNVNLQQPVTLTFHKVGATITYDVSGTGTGNPTGLSYTPGATISYNGWSVAVSGSPAEGDTFQVGPNTNGVGDNRNALLLAGLQNRNLVAVVSGPASGVSLQGAYGQLVGMVGAKTQQVQSASQAQSSLLEQINANQQSVSGVNLDEEAANLIKYQQAYQAAGKILAIADRLFDTVLALGK